ncbi:hypothetical protein C9980_08585 [Vibrio mediterranei]|uniref:hypothetical protein n=1 Tax=Vibrio mediterranei TaxID=689 RepID=UPI000D1821F8|nr:hypothetical protein [Vibrio mediterranei]PTC05294.1 hypothetical protein C9980_08585 [Vibrio mediterranei]
MKNITKPVLLLSVLLPSVSFAQLQLSPEELAKKKEIYEKFDTQSVNITLKQFYDEIDILRYNNDAVINEIGNKQEDIESTYNSLVNLTSEKKEINEYLINRLQNNIAIYNESVAKLNSDTNKEAQLVKKIKNNEDEKQAIEKSKELELAKLKKDIETRLKQDADKEKKVFFDGKVVCSSSMTLSDCFNKNKANIVSQAMKSAVGEYRVHATKVEDANLNINGTLSYSVAITYTQPFSLLTIKEINKELGISTKDIKLSSNKEATYYINGKKVGEGKEVLFRNSYNSKVIVKAVYDKKSQSSIEELGPENDLYYPF